MIEVVLYTRANCHLCHQTEADLNRLQVAIPHRLSVIDIDQSPDLQDEFGNLIPVVEVGSIRLEAPISPQELEKALKSARNSTSQVPGQYSSTVGSGRLQTHSKADRIAYWITRHYLAIFNVLVLLYVGLPFLAPVFMQAGLVTPANLIYRGYGLLCHQLSYRSFFVFGEQIVYPRTAAGMDELLTFGEATGMGEGNDPGDVFAARNYLGDERVGYKVALCQRDVAIWGGMLIFGLLFGISGKRIPGLKWYLWILIALVPVGLDGLSQLISQPPLGWLPYRESTPLLRLITGFLFGFVTAWFAYPLVDEAMRDTQKIMESKRVS